MDKHLIKSQEDFTSFCTKASDIDRRTLIPTDEVSPLFYPCVLVGYLDADGMTYRYSFVYARHFD